MNHRGAIGGTMSVVLATKNGARTLGRMLEALCALETGRGEYEILAVDNGSTDDTVEVLRSYSLRLPITVLSCPEPGKNAALNVGVAQARGDLVVLTDDDVLPAMDWLTQLRAVAAEHPDIAVFGGRVVPQWPSPPPRWILDHVDLAVCFAIHADDLQEGATQPWVIWGPNMMVRSEVFRAGFRFNQAIGPSEGQYIMGSETEFVRRVLAAGYRCCTSRRPVVRHIIEEHQFRPEWLLDRARRYGKWRCVEEELFSAKRRWPLLPGAPPWHVLAALVERLLAAVTGVLAGDERSFRHRWKLQRELGYLEQFRAMAAARSAERFTSP